ncbi:MAG: hypothetical protein EBQ96_02320 [Proteobacteria bacterium]|nr:hypothetical protein [Pseudomonadota bacterium]
MKSALNFTAVSVVCLFQALSFVSAEAGAIESGPFVAKPHSNFFEIKPTLELLEKQGIGPEVKSIYNMETRTVTVIPSDDPSNVSVRAFDPDKEMILYPDMQTGAKVSGTVRQAFCKLGAIVVLSGRLDVQAKDAATVMYARYCPSGS